MLTRTSIALTLAAASAVAAPATAPSSASSAPTSSASSTAGTGILTADGFTNQKWLDAFHKAKEVVGGLSFDQKINFTDLRGFSVNTPYGGCAGITFPLPSAGINQGICFADGPTGVRQTRYSTQFPAEVTSAATWDRDLIHERALAIGKEYAEVGAQVPLSIVVGPMGRSVYGGRNWEGFSSEPYLAGEAVRLTVDGFQKEGVTGLVKHFYGNEQEYLRQGLADTGYIAGPLDHIIDSIIDQATARELYIAPFAEAVRAGAGGIMCSYNKLNGTAACENKELLIDILKEELAFPGFVVTDWYAGHTTLGAALNGTDYVEASEPSVNLFGAKLAPAIQNGSVPEALLDDKIIRMLVPYFALNQSSLPAVDYDRYVASQETADTARKVAEEGITLLKNNRTSNLGLPLCKPKDLILVGSAAAPGRFGIFGNVPIVAGTPSLIVEGFLGDGFGSGTSEEPYAVDPLSAFTARGRQEKRPVVVDGYYYDDPLVGVVPNAVRSNTSILDEKLLYADATMVFVNAIGAEGYDRVNLTLGNNGDNLIDYVADRHNNTIVVITAPGPVDMSQWIDHVNVTAVLFTYFSGQEGGTAMARVAFGDVNPSGKLPFTIAKNISDYDQKAIYHGDYVVNPTTNFTEGVYIDYKWFDKQGIEPLFEFGYGKSYTTFNVSGFSLYQNKKANPPAIRETKEKLFINGKQASGLYDYVYTVKATVKNTGSVDGAEVAQLYLTFPDSTPNKMPVHNLRGFAKPYLKAGESQDVYFDLRNKDLTVWSVEKQGWIIPSGKFKVSVGTSSRNLPLSKTFSY
ncbi:hypothetical protein JCM10049v2_000729 [Rhodotorula toruloides]